MRHHILSQHFQINPGWQLQAPPSPPPKLPSNPSESSQGRKWLVCNKSPPGSCSGKGRLGVFHSCRLRGGGLHSGRRERGEPSRHSPLVPISRADWPLSQPGLCRAGKCVGWTCSAAGPASSPPPPETRRDGSSAIFTPPLSSVCPQGAALGSGQMALGRVPAHMPCAQCIAGLCSCRSTHREHCSLRGGRLSRNGKVVL